MALSDILARIHQEAEAEARQVRARGKAEAEKVLAEARAEAGVIREDLLREGDEVLRGERDGTLSAARIRTRKDILARKKELLDGLFREVPALLHERPAADYAKVLCGFVEEEAAALPGTLETGGDDAGRFGETFPGLVVETLGKTYASCRLTASTRPGDFRQGIVIRTDELVHNLSLDSLLESLRGRLESRVAALLFAP